MKSKQVEILAPAGSFRSLEAAVCAGADAVYVGGEKFGARAFAANFDTEELLRAMDYVHIHGRKIYLTVNTLLKEKELEGLVDYLTPFYLNGLDAVIVQDVGVLDLIRKVFPDLAVHVSTQMTVTSEAGARFFRGKGVTRIVPARELSLEEIRNMKEKSGLEIECFVHGAMCYCYSGQCLMSSMIGGRSGNRGQCAQPCRLSYRIGEGKPQNILSMKDLCTVELIPDLIEAGIDSFKIEGRMKQPDYVYQVTQMYRKYTDRYFETGKERFQAEKKDLAELEGIYQRRGYFQGYYRSQNGRHMISFQRPKGTKDQKEELALPKMQEKINGMLILSVGNHAKLELDYQGISVEITGEIVQPAKNQPLTRERVEKQMKKTGEEPFCFQDLQIQLEGDVFLPMQALNTLRREGLGKLKETLLDEQRRKKDQIIPLQDCHPDASLQTPAREGFLARVEKEDQLETVWKDERVGEIILDGELLYKSGEFLGNLRESGQKLLFAMPYIFRDEARKEFSLLYEKLEENCDGVLIRNWESRQWLLDQGFAKEIYSDYNLYEFNSWSKRFLSENGICTGTAPVELNSKELSGLGLEKTMLIVYGYQPVMITANCIQKNDRGCEKKEGILYLEDRQKKKFPVKNRCRYCYNIIYNCAPLALLGQGEEVRRLNPAGLRIDFTFETGRQAGEILDLCGQAFAKGTHVPPLEMEYTKGHFKRGVK